MRFTTGIVKGMLHHNQKSGGAKEPADLNALAEEYLSLGFHSFTSKDKSFPEIQLITDSDPGLGLVNVIPQEIGRVSLNLYNTSFQATAKSCLLSESYLTVRARNEGRMK